MLILVFSSIILTTALSVEKNAVTVPIGVQQNTRTSSAILSRIRYRYTVNSQLAVEPSLAATLQGYQSGEFFVTGKIGLELGASGDFKLFLDTGYANLWVYDKNCRTSKKKCPAENKFDCLASLTCRTTNETFIIDDEGAPANAVVYEDMFCLFMDLCTNYNQKIAAALTDPTYSGLDMDGVFGASFNSLSVPMPGALKQFFEDPRCSNRLFALWMNRSADGKNVGGEMHICETVSTRFVGPITYAPSKAPDFWRIGVSSVAIGKTHFADSVDAMVDTGSLYMVGPSDQVALLQQAIGATYIGGGEYQVDCNKIAQLPDLVFNIGGTDFVLKGADYAIRIVQNGNNICISGILGMDIPPPNGPVWVLGSLFVEKFYTVFDFDNVQVGFATPIYTQH